MHLIALDILDATYILSFWQEQVQSLGAVDEDVIGAQMLCKIAHQLAEVGRGHHRKNNITLLSDLFQ